MLGLFKPKLSDHEKLEIVTSIQQHLDNNVKTSKPSHIELELKGLLTLADSINSLPEGLQVEINTLNVQGLTLKKVNGKITITD